MTKFKATLRSNDIHIWTMILIIELHMYEALQHINVQNYNLIYQIIDGDDHAKVVWKLFFQHCSDVDINYSLSL